jgi:choline dehydrogenase-like flavoprotein
VVGCSWTAGCSLVNGMLYNRGSWQIFDDWGPAAQRASAWNVHHKKRDCSSNDGGVDDRDGSAVCWSAAACLPYFKKHEDNARCEGTSCSSAGDGSTAAAAWHGSGGEVRVSDIPRSQLSPVACAFHAAGKSLSKNLLRWLNLRGQQHALAWCCQNVVGALPGL